MGTHPIFESDFDCLTATHTDSHEAPKMPGVQDNYSIDVTNRYGFAVDDPDSGSDEGIENVDPFAMINELKKQAEIAKKAPKPVKKKAAPVVAAQPEKKEGSNESEKKPQRDNKRGERGGARGDRRGGRGDGRPRGERPPRENRQQNDGDSAPREDRPRRGGRGGMRGGSRRDGDRRTFDRRSGDPRSSVKGSDKRDGAGSGNWGTPEDDLKAQTEVVDVEKTSEENVEKEEPKEPKVEQEPEPNTMTLEEYRKSKKSALRNPNARSVEAPAVKTEKAPKERAAKGRAARMEAVDFVAAPLVQRGGGRGDRRGATDDVVTDHERNPKRLRSI